ncbi:nibrin isoform X2 [Mugil cephalus]|uniref:nibrin isoform X2 n=1 Tax=Mugil cephalus TaxID=48193 RepID=UPI001FB5CB60|nr:nibrin isoform X2 [Mugil cephalus]
MWILTPLQTGGETHYLRPDKGYVVGRKNCDIILQSDQSISRAHAHLTASDETLTLKDTSKYGTFVNNQRLTAPVNLKAGDTITFGVFESKFSVGHQKPVVSSSCLDNDGKASLSQTLLALGGKLVNNWTQDCTHLAMPSVKVTIKTISALLCCRPIVKPEFFSELNRAVEQKLPPPKAESFIPEIDEPSLSKEDVNVGLLPLRKQLFTGKTFVFLSAKQLKRLSAPVSFGGGRSQLLEEGSLPRDLLESPQSCVVDVMSGNSQSLLPPSATEWANSVKSIVQRKGLRVITESEIGLAAILASCDKHCNPSSHISDSDSVPKMKPRIPSASLSQSVAVDETVLPAASQNITAYAVNTEQSQRNPYAVCEVSRVASVEETPEKKQNQRAGQPHGSKLTAKKAAMQCIVADTMSSSCNTGEIIDSQRKKPDSTLTGSGSAHIRPPTSTSRTNSGMKAPFYKQSPQKYKPSAQASPQKQSTLTNFFQAVNKKRPLEDELSAGMSEPKRPVLESSISSQAPNSSTMHKESPSPALRGPASHTPHGSAADLFTAQSETLSEEPRSRKRKEMEQEIQIDELESIMSLDMDFMDEDDDQGKHQAQPKAFSPATQKQGLNSEETSSSCKRQRVHVEENGKSVKRPEEVGMAKESGPPKKPQPEQHRASIKTEPVHPTDYVTSYHKSSKPPQKSSASSSKTVMPFEEDEGSFIEDVELLSADICQPKEEPKTPLRPVMVKEEVGEPKIDENLPKKLLLVEFRSLTVTAPPKVEPKQMRGNGYGNNFKCFRKNMLVAKGSPQIIGGPDLLVHARGKNSDLDEWLKDAAEEERQNRRDETIGDDLFRYNPSKLTKRR